MKEEAIKKEAAASKTDEIVDRWFSETFYDRGIQTETFNLLLDAKEGLKKRLNKEV